MAVFAFAFAGCSQDAGDSPAPHEHAFAAEWTSNETHHWHAATCGHDVKKDEAPHEWDHEDFQYDAESGREIKTCTVCGFVADKNHAHTEDSGTVTTAVTLNTDGVRTYKCTVCGEDLRTEPITKPKLYESPIDAETGLPATKASKYIYFGVFPKTVLFVCEPWEYSPNKATVDETVSVKMGANTYYKGSNGEYYAKVMENAYDTGSAYKYSDGTQAKQSDAESYRYFKVEPIKWKVITDSYSGKCLLLAEDILTANVPYYVEEPPFRTIADKPVYANNYKYSTIRAYLNGKYESDDTQSKTAYENKGFLQTAFTSTAQLLIADTRVSNLASDAGDSGNNIYGANCYACADTTDKIFLLSEREVTREKYGFAAYDSYGQENARIRVTTDYAKANYAFQSSTAGYGGYWWLRSPYYDDASWALYVKYNGSADTDFGFVDNTYYCVVPALCLDLK